MADASFIEKIEKIKMSYRILILVGTLLLLGTAFVFLIYLPKTEEIDSLEKNISNLKEKVVQAKKAAADLPKFEAEYAQVDAEFKEALSLLPNEREIPSLLTTITQLGRESNLEFRLFSPEKEKPRDFYMEIPVAMEVSFDKVGRIERIVNMFDVEMKPQAELSTDLVTKCRAVTYRFKGAADETKPAKKTQ